MKKATLFLTIFTALTTITACQKNRKKEPILENYSIHRDEEFGGAYIDISIDAFNKLGFQFGDSVNLLTANYHSKVNSYLLSIGLSQGQIDAAQAKLSK